MAFNVGAIISKLTLDKSGWNQSVKDVGKDQTKMQGMSDKTAGKFKKMGAAMTVAGGVIIGALGAMTKKFVDTGDWIDKMSKRTGFGAEALSELAFAADLSGASLTDVEKAVKRMAGTILDAESGLETYLRSFRQMGIEIDDLMQMNPEQQFLAISEAIASIEDPTIRAALAQDVFGRAGTALLPMMSEGAEGLAKMRQEARDLGIIFTEETAKSAADLKDAQTALSESVKGLSMAFTQHIVPILTDVAQKMTATIAKVSEWARENPQLAQTIIKIVAGLGGLLTVLGPIVMLVPKLVLGAKMLAGGFTVLLSPVGLLVAALAALTLGYMKVKAAQDAANKSAETALDQEKKLIRKLAEAAAQAGVTGLEFLKLKDSYDGNAAAMAMAIKRGEEGIEMQKALAGVSAKQKEEIDKQRVATDDLGFSMENLTGRFQGYLDELKETKTETKTWIDYLKDVGITTVQEKETRVKELTTYLGQLKTAYDKGKLTLEDYTNATNAARKEIEDLSTEITTTTIPAARNMAGVYEQAVTDMTVKTDDFTVKTGEKLTEVVNVWAGMWESIKDNAKLALGDMLAGNITFKNAVGLVWNDMKQKFADIVADMVINFAIDGVKELIGGATKAASGIGTAISSISSATAPLAAGIGTLITTLATAIATAAEIIAAAAPAILIAAGVALAIYAGFKIISGLFGKKTPPVEKDQLHELRLIKEQLAFNLPPLFHGMINHLALIQEFTGVRIPLKQDVTNRILRKIKVNTDPIKKMISAARGAYVTEPTMAVLHGSSADPEIVTPASKIAENLEGFGAGSQGMNQNINVNIYVKDQLDPYSAQRITREQIVPNMLKAIEVDSIQKTRMRNILGVQV